jgi:hypothetical protein
MQYDDEKKALMDDLEAETNQNDNISDSLVTVGSPDEMTVESC